MPRVRQRSEAVDVDHGQLVYPSLEDVAFVVGLDEFAPGSGRATSRRHRRRFEWFTQVRENLADRPRLGCNAMSRMSPSHLGHSSGNSSPTRAISFAQAIRVVRAGLCRRVATDSGAVTVAPMAAGRGIARRADVPDGE